MDETGGGGISPNGADRQSCLTEADKAMIPATWAPERSANIAVSLAYLAMLHWGVLQYVMYGLVLCNIVMCSTA